MVNLEVEEYICNACSICSGMIMHAYFLARLYGAMRFCKSIIDNVCILKSRYSLNGKLCLHVDSAVRIE